MYCVSFDVVVGNKLYLILSYLTSQKIGDGKGDRGMEKNNGITTIKY